MSLFQRKRTESAAAVSDTISTQTSQFLTPFLEELLEHYKNRLLAETNLEPLIAAEEIDRRISIERLISQFMLEEKVVISKMDRETLLTRLIDETVGFGPIEQLLKDPSITEILVNGPKEIHIERNGRLEASPVTFKNEEHVRHIVDRVIAPLGRRIDESSPMVDARLPDGSRVNAVIPPISLNGTLLSIRKFRKEPFEMEDLLRLSSLDERMAEFIQALVKAKLNILISGGTGSGKTTLLNAVAKAIPISERVITIEDSAELRLNRGSVVGMEARPANVEGQGEISIRQLVRNSLRMRPDRIIVGEVRGAEAFDMLQAMNTGHEGSLTTVHSNSPVDAVSRVEGMVIMAGMDLPSEIIREYIVGALDFIIQADRLGDGQRKIVNISEVYVDEDKGVKIRDVFIFKRTGTGKNGEVQGYFTPTGYIPQCLNHLKMFGIELDESIFSMREEVAQWT
ncbi:CpaF family protein [Planococcus shenhongbingii]|uniref:CpaF family protein n=1 Tax=Planococcus shenhongbingii TaxID=3058398 RepID=A0ABT8NB47_9BACL|nr:CpaF family protein [Planococcus sp. N017]MDN7244897.1 CpaF family protein [Planococcus sp. N017]